MPHCLFIGNTGSGKTTLASRIANDYRQAGINTIVLDPMLDPRWNATILTADKEYFLSIVSDADTRNCAIFVDESGEMIGQYDKEMFFLATRLRHQGHNCHFITQRPQQLNPTVRTQCTYIFAFKCSDGEFLAKEFTIPLLKECGSLNRWEYIEARSWGESCKKLLEL